MKRLYSTAEAAEYLGMGVSSFQRQVLARRRLKPVSLLDKKYLYCIRDLDRLVDESKKSQAREEHRNATATN